MIDAECCTKNVARHVLLLLAKPSLSSVLSGGGFLRIGSFGAILVPKLERMSALLLCFADFSIACGSGWHF
jgi:hypothetical protein